MQFKETELVGYFTEHFCHAGYDLIMVVLEDEGLEKVRHELLLDFVAVDVLKDFHNRLDSLHSDIGLLIIQQFVNLRQKHILEPLCAKKLLSVHLQVLLQEGCPLDPDLVVGVLAHAQHESLDHRFLVHGLLCDIFSHRRCESETQLPLGKGILDAWHILDDFYGDLLQIVELDPTHAISKYFNPRFLQRSVLSVHVRGDVDRQAQHALGIHHAHLLNKRVL